MPILPPSPYLAHPEALARGQAQLETARTGHVPHPQGWPRPLPQATKQEAGT